ncbi:MAG: YSIRK-type signal peptide-containing protein [Lactobacillus sp.]|jgi:hypothetical protein|nr:YSIRK-type signal peptide-containing protein [Lactobacillus sp.]
MFRGDKKQIFSIRKLTIGAASVMIGATLLGFGSQSNIVRADAPQTQQGQTEKPNITRVTFTSNKNIQVFSDIAAKIEITDLAGNSLGVIKNNKNFDSVDLSRVLKNNEQLILTPYNVYGVKGNAVSCYYTNNGDLQSVYDEYENRNVTSTAQYKNSSQEKKTAFDKALNKAKEILILYNTDQSGVNQAAANLKAAFNALDGKSDPVTPGQSMADTTRISAPKVVYPVNIDQSQIDQGYFGPDSFKDIILIQRAFKQANKDLADKVTFEINDDKLSAVFSDGSRKNLDLKPFFVESEAHKNPVKEPDFPLKVADTSRLSDEENAKLLDLIKTTNPRVVSVSKKYDTFLLTYSDGSTNSFYLNNSDWISTYDHNGSESSTGLTTVFPPKSKITAQDSKHLSEKEKAQIIENLRESNPNVISYKVNDLGYVRLNFDYPNGSFGLLSPADVLNNPSVDKPAQPSGSKLADTTKVNIPKLSFTINSSVDSFKYSEYDNDINAIKVKIQRAIRRANPDLIGKAKFEIQNGNLNIVFSDNSVKTIDMSQFVKPSEAFENPIKTPDFPVKSSNIYHPNKNEYKQFVSLVKKYNPKVVSISDDPVSPDGGYTGFILTYSDGSKNQINMSDIPNWFSSYSHKGTQPNSGLTDVYVPKTKITAKDPNHLSQAEKDQIIANLKVTNPDVSTYQVNDQGYVKLGFDYPQGSYGLMAPSDVLTNAAKTPTTPDQPSQPDQPSNPGTDTPSTPTIPTNPSTSGKTDKPSSDDSKEEALSTVMYAPVINGNENWKIALRDSNGKLTGKYISTGSSWKVFAQRRINGVLYYRLGSQEQWVPAEYLNDKTDIQDNGSSDEVKMSTTGYVARLVKHPTWKIALYNSKGKVTSYLVPNSNWKVLARKKINGRLMYRLGTDNQWIPAEYINVK